MFSTALQVPPSPLEVKSLADFLKKSDVCILTGAGISTESGIPDYRGPETSKKQRNPIQHHEFLNSEFVRRKYWARSFVGWPRVRDSLPNPGHLGVYELESRNLVSGVITQNVDRLHQKAGSTRTIELHGRLDHVICLSCGTIYKREYVQKLLSIANTHWKFKLSELAPDGDVEIPDEETATFRVPTCENCDGILKPNVVFFGDSVPENRVTAAWAIYKKARSVLVLGSSLTVYSGYRFIRQAEKDGKPVAIVNIGRTRGDGGAVIKVDTSISTILPEIIDLL